MGTKPHVIEPRIPLTDTSFHRHVLPDYLLVARAHTHARAGAGRMRVANSRRLDPPGNHPVPTKGTRARGYPAPGLVSFPNDCPDRRHKTPVDHPAPRVPLHSCLAARHRKPNAR